MFPKQQVVLHVSIYVSSGRDTVCLYMGYKKLTLALHREWESASAAAVPAGRGLVP